MFLKCLYKFAIYYVEYQNSNFGYPLLTENQMIVPENPLYQENRLLGADSPLPTMPNITTMAEPRNQFANSHSDAFRSSMVTIPLDKLKRMRAAKGKLIISNIFIRLFYG